MGILSGVQNFLTNVGNKIGTWSQNHVIQPIINNNNDVRKQSEQENAAQRPISIKNMVQVNPGMTEEQAGQSYDNMFNGQPDPLAQKAIDFGTSVVQAFPRQVSQIWQSITGHSGFTPSTQAQRWLYGDQPVDNIRHHFEANKTFVQQHFGTSNVASSLYALPLTLAGTMLNLDPGVGDLGEKTGAKLTDKLGFMALSKDEKAISKTLEGIDGIKFTDQQLADASKEIKGISNPQDVQSFLTDFVTKGTGDSGYALNQAAKDATTVDEFKNHFMPTQLGGTYKTIQDGQNAIQQIPGMTTAQTIISDAHNIKITPDDTAETLAKKLNTTTEEVKNVWNDALQKADQTNNQALQDFMDKAKNETSKFAPQDLNAMADYTDGVIAKTRTIPAEENQATREMAAKYGIDPTLPDDKLAQQFTKILDENWGSDFKAKLNPDQLNMLKGYQDELTTLNQTVKDSGPNSKLGQEAAARMDTIKNNLQSLSKEAAIGSSPDVAATAVFGQAGADMKATDQAVNVADKFNANVPAEPPVTPPAVEKQVVPLNTIIDHEATLRQTDPNFKWDATDKATVQKYEQAIKNGEQPTVKLIAEQNGQFGVEDGRHTLEAYKNLGVDNVPVEIYNTQQDLANAANGVAEAAPVADKAIPELTAEQVKKLEPEQLQLFQMADPREIPDDLVSTIKMEIGNNGKVSGGTMDSLRDILYNANRITDVNFAVNDNIYSYKQMVKEMTNAGMDVTDDIKKTYEYRMADRISQSIKGDVAPYLDKMEKAGIRKEIIDEMFVGGTRLTDAVKIKKGLNGETGAIISKNLLDKVSEAGAKVPRIEGKNVKAFSMANITDKLKTMGHELALPEVPQEYFRRLGLQDIIYNPVRWSGEGRAITAADHYRTLISDAFKNVDKTESAKIWNYLASRQTDIADKLMKNGEKIVDFSELSDQGKKVVATYNEIHQELEPLVKAQADRAGHELETIPNHFPMPIKKNLVRIGEDAAYTDKNYLRSSPFFKNILARDAGTPLEQYARDPLGAISEYIYGATKYSYTGEQTLAAKYLVDSAEFQKAFGEKVSNEVKDWLGGVTTPKKPGNIFEKLALKSNSLLYVSQLAFNVRSAARQYETSALYHMVRGGEFTRNPKEIKALAKELPAILSREPYLGMEQFSDKYTKVAFMQTTWTDKIVGQGVLSDMLAKQLKANGVETKVFGYDDIMGALGDLESKMGKSISVSSNDFELLAGGTTAAQRPKTYRSTLGKIILPFTSVVNSETQWTLKETMKAVGDYKVDGKTMKMIEKMARITTATVAIAYMDAVITNMSFGTSDPQKTAADSAKALLGKIPVLGGVVFGVESGNYDSFAGDNSVAAAFKNLKAGNYGDMTWSMLEAMGAPKQLRRSVQGIQSGKGPRYIIGGKNVDYGVSSPISTSSSSGSSSGGSGFFGGGSSPSSSGGGSNFFGQ